MCHRTQRTAGCLIVAGPGAHRACFYYFRHIHCLFPTNALCRTCSIAEPVHTLDLHICRCYAGQW